MGRGPARHGQNGRGTWAARHGETAHVPCHGPKAWPMARPGTARPARRHAAARRSAVPARHGRAACRVGTARWPTIGRRQPAAVVADASAPACPPPTPRADPGAPPPDALPHLLLRVISFSFPFSFCFLIRFINSIAGSVPFPFPIGGTRSRKQERRRR